MIAIKITLLTLFLSFVDPLIINSLPTDFVSIAIDLDVIVEIEPIINYKLEKIYMKKPTDQTSDIEDMFDSLKPSRKEQAVIWLLSPVIVLCTWAVLIFICSL